MIGTAKVPKVLRLPKNPKAVDLSRSLSNRQKLKGLYQNSILKEDEVKQESSESEAIDQIEKYFDINSNEDVFIMINQDLRDPKDNTWHERDIFAINLSRGYILNLEVKSVLRDGKGEDTKVSKKIKKPAHVQLQRTMKILTNHFENPLVLQQEWKVINLVYAPKIDLDFTLCSAVKEFIITEDDDFISKLTSILEKYAPTVNSYSYVKDFCTMVSELLPERVRICNEFVQTFQKPVNEVILQKITENVEEKAGSVENISYWSKLSYWSKDQYDVVAHSKILKRVLFDSAFSTGKTLLMMECARQRLLEGGKVLFIIRTGAPNEHPILLNIKLQGFFQDKDNFKITQCVFKNGFEVKKIITEHNDHHIFIDELFFGHGAVTMRSIKQWSQLGNPDKHFWVVIGYGKGLASFDRTKLEGCFYIPNLIYPLRNPKEVVELVKTKVDGLNSLYSSVFHGDCMSQLKVPNGLTNTFKPYQIVAANYNDGFEKTLNALDQVFSDFRPALFLFVDSDDDKIFKCQCYNGNDNCKQRRSHINSIFHQKINRPEPIQYWDPKDYDEVKDWVLKLKDKDIIMQRDMANGFEHNLVVVFQSQNPEKFYINESMRSTAMLIVVSMPEQQLENLCFGKCKSKYIDSPLNEIQ